MLPRGFPGRSLRPCSSISGPIYMIQSHMFSQTVELHTGISSFYEGGTLDLRKLPPKRSKWQFRETDSKRVYGSGAIVSEPSSTLPEHARRETMPLERTGAGGLAPRLCSREPALTEDVHRDGIAGHPLHSVESTFKVFPILDSKHLVA